MSDKEQNIEEQGAANTEETHQPIDDVTEPAVTETDKDENNDGMAAPNPFKKRKCAVYVIYVGHGYHGMQRNPGCKTIEEDLFNAIRLAGGIAEHNADERGYTKIHWSRAARTDKGVSACGQVVSLMLVTHPDGLVERINSHLSHQIRVLGFHRVTKGFDARKSCDKRRYEYIMPAWMFDPAFTPPPAAWVDRKTEDRTVPAKEDADRCGDNQGDATTTNNASEIDAPPSHQATARAPEDALEEDLATETPGLMPPTDSSFVFDQSCIDRLSNILGQFEGTHNFHNYTVRVSHSDAQAKRYILSFKCTGVFEIDGRPWVRMVVIGQSFMLHQIRKMIGMAVAIFRGTAPEKCLTYALKTKNFVNVPMAPDLGLFLDECYYESYSKRFARLHERLSQECYAEAISTFKKETLYPALAARDEREIVNAKWLRNVTENYHKFSLWGTMDEIEKEHVYDNPKRKIAAEANRAAKKQMRERGNADGEKNGIDGEKLKQNHHYDGKRHQQKTSSQQQQQQQHVSGGSDKKPKEVFNPEYSD